MVSWLSPPLSCLKDVIAAALGDGLVRHTRFPFSSLRFLPKAPFASFLVAPARVAGFPSSPYKTRTLLLVAPVFFPSLCARGFHQEFIGFFCLFFFCALSFCGEAQMGRKFGLSDRGFDPFLHFLSVVFRAWMEGSWTFCLFKFHGFPFTTRPAWMLCGGSGCTLLICRVKFSLSCLVSGGGS